MRLHSKFGPKLQKRWARLKDMTLEGEDEFLQLKIELIDVTKKDLRSIADELVCSSFGSSATVDDTGITLFGYDPLMGDLGMIEESVTALLREYNYELLQSAESTSC